MAMAGFLVGQVVVWRALALAGDGLATGPAASFFYLLSGLHGLHILGGVGALALILARDGSDARRLARAGRLCVVYCDFLLVVWGGLLLLFAGWANRLVDLCRGALT
jgi:cytochrome c oxidase subunit 3